MFPLGKTTLNWNCDLQSKYFWCRHSLGPVLLHIIFAFKQIEIDFWEIAKINNLFSGNDMGIDSNRCMFFSCLKLDWHPELNLSWDKYSEPWKVKRRKNVANFDVAFNRGNCDTKNALENFFSILVLLSMDNSKFH